MIRSENDDNKNGLKWGGHEAFRRGLGCLEMNEITLTPWTRYDPSTSPIYVYGNIKYFLHQPLQSDKYGV